MATVLALIVASIGLCLSGVLVLHVIALKEDLSKHREAYGAHVRWVDDMLNGLDSRISEIGVQHSKRLSVVESSIREEMGPVIRQLASIETRLNAKIAPKEPKASTPRDIRIANSRYNAQQSEQQEITHV